MPPNFTIHVHGPLGKTRIITITDIENAIRAAGYVPETGIKQLQFVVQRTLAHLDTPIVLTPEPTPTEPEVA